MATFNGLRLHLARRRRRLSQTELAKLVDVKPSVISSYERFGRAPDEKAVKAFARALRFPVDFLCRTDPCDIPAQSVSFRSLASMRAQEREAVLAVAQIGYELVDWIAKRIPLPPVCIPRFEVDHDPVIAARLTRNYLEISSDPIDSVLQLLERKGARILCLNEHTNTVDACSFWNEDQPFVLLNGVKSAERSIFDLAHELGHLVLHRNVDKNTRRDLEKEANVFASEFLMPEDDVYAHVRRPVTTDGVIEHKKRWRVSAMALAYRLRTLNLVGDTLYRDICIDLSQRGFRSSEPYGGEREKSALWPEVLRSLWSQRVTQNDISEELGLDLSEVDSLLGGGVVAAREAFSGDVKLAAVPK